MSDIRRGRFNKECKPIKVKLEETFCKFIKDNGISGSVLSLTGPDIIRHIDNYGKLLSPTSHFVVAEMDDKVFNMIKDSASNNYDIIYNLLQRNSMPQFECGIYIHNKRYIDAFRLFTPKTMKDRFGILDLDFCITARKLISNIHPEIPECEIDYIGEMLKSDKTKDKLALIITFCRRYNGYMYDTPELEKKIHSVILNSGYQRHKHVGIPYRDRDSPPMESWVWILKKIGIR